METQALLNFALAMSLTELIHVMSEMSTVRFKLARLRTYMDGKPFKEPPGNINTRTKSYGVSLAIFVVTAGLSYAFFLWLDLSLRTSLQTIIGLLILSYAIATVGFDQYHVDIEKITKPFKDKITKNNGPK